MGDQRSKPNISVGLLAHVGASRREPHLNSKIPGLKTGDFSCSVEAKLFQRSKIPPYVVVLHKQKPQHMVVDFLKFGFVAVFRAGNEVSIDENISVGYKGESLVIEIYLAVRLRCLFQVVPAD